MIEMNYKRIFLQRKIIKKFLNSFKRKIPRVNKNHREKLEVLGVFATLISSHYKGASIFQRSLQIMKLKHST